MSDDHAYRDYPLSFVQESLWVSEQFTAGTSPYVENWAQRLRGHLDVDALTGALRQIADRHPALRSQFIRVDNRLIQRVQRDADLVITQADWRGRDPCEALATHARQPMDIREAAARVALLKLAPHDHILLVQCHHIVVDDHSFELLSSEIQALYAAALRGGSAQLPEAGISPGQHAADQRARGISESSLEWWTRYLDGAEPLHELPPAGRSPQPRQGNRCDRVTAAVDTSVARRVRELARTIRTTPTVVMLTSLGMALAASVGATDVVLGQAVSQRGPASLEEVFGCFTDTMPLRLHTLPEATFSDLCGSVKRDVISALRHRDAPWADVAKRLPRTPGMLPGEGLIRVVMVVEEPAQLVLPGLECERVYVVPAGVKFDWCVYVVAAAGGYSCYVDYAADLYTADEAALVLRQWTRTLGEASGNPGLTVAALSRTLSAGLT
jgi:hypothetical protein